MNSTASTETRRPGIQPSAERHEASAFTLVEVMMALMLGSVVVAVCATITVQTAQLQSGVDARIARRWQRQRVGDQFAADVKSVLRGLPSDTNPIVINENDTQILRVFALADIPSVNLLGSSRTPAEITYRVSAASHETAAKRLIRRVRDLADPQGATYEYVLAEGLEDVRIEQFDNDSWRSKVERREGVPLDPVALRLICTWRRRPSIPDVRTVLLNGDRKTNKERNPGRGPI